MWDADPGTAGTQDGNGIWADGAPNWFNQTGTLENQMRINGSDAVFGSSGSAGFVTLTGPVSVGDILFAPVASGTYTLEGSHALTLLGSTITTTADAIITVEVAGSQQMPGISFSL